jgi:hypothetical protein
LCGTVPSVADEVDGTGSLDLFKVDVEICGSISMRGVTKLFAQSDPELYLVEKKIPVTLNPELISEIAAGFPPSFSNGLSHFVQ